jgi:hypothetical protein
MTTVQNWLNAHLKVGINNPTPYNDGALIRSVEGLLMSLTEWAKDDKQSITVSDGSIKVVQWDNPGGHGAHMSVVIEVIWPGGTTLLQGDGYHSSYDHSTWEAELIEVEPYEMSVTRYRPINTSDKETTMPNAELLARTDVSSFMKLLKKEYDIRSDFYLETLNNIVIGGESFELSCVYSKGGIEGEGEHVERVFEVKKDGQTLNFIRTIGYYDSWDGTDWSEEYDEVKPVEVTVTRYVRPGETPKV